MAQGTLSLMKQLLEALGLMVKHREAPVLGVLYQQHIGVFWKP